MGVLTPLQTMNSNNNPTRATTKESYLSEAHVNLNNCNRPSKIANSQTYLITHKRPERPENQDISKRKKVVSRRQTYSESTRKASNNLVIFGDSITNFSRYHQNIFIQKIEDRRARVKYFLGSLSRDILFYVNPTLDESESDAAIIHVGVNDLLNCEGDIDQINNILRNIEHIV